ncbi:MAG: hypothetical protein ABIO05_07525 [Ferruginibacter sp.]
METKSTQQEIIFFINTQFSQKQVKKIGATGKQSNATHIEKLEDACWNGLVMQVLPEICDQSGNIGLTLWEIKKANSFFDLQFSEYPNDFEPESSIDPYKFMQIQCEN